MDKITARKIIGVEGKDDQRFIQSLLSHLNIADVQIIEVEGKTNFRTQILALKNTPGFSQVEICAFIRDSDRNPPNAAFQSLADSLRVADLVPPATEQVFSNGTPRVGIFIMPGDGHLGAIEDLCLDSIKDDEGYQCIESYFDCIGFLDRATPKSKVLCYLSGKLPTCNSLGYAALRGYWNFEKDSFTRIKNFISNFM